MIAREFLTDVCTHSLTNLESLIRTIDDILIWSGPLETLVFQKF